ncbi:MAG: peptide chain release factor 2 [Deltaproteobacteria bacterium]|nr:peptide chain release factor 2 [Deltaproteobacteria bacterium]
MRLTRSGSVLKRFEGVFDIAGKESRISELEKRIADPHFWDSSEEAQKIAKERTRWIDEIARWRRLEDEIQESADFLALFEQEEEESLGKELQQKVHALEKEVRALELEQLLGGENDPKNAIVSINAGAGGTEAQDWADMLLRMYLRWAASKNYAVELLDQQPGEQAGIKSATFLVQGPYAYGYFRAEVGIHRLVRISPFDANKRRHTSFASLFVSPEIDETIEVEIRDEDLRIDTYRAGGAGGQHVNKTDSAVRLTHLPTGMVVQCQNERSQHKNKALAMKVLRSRLYELEQQKKDEELQKLHAEKKEIGWGSQIRSYILQPYQLVKDHRTHYEVGNVAAVLDGELDEFIWAYLLKSKH